jgi:cell division protein ZapE
MSFVPSSPLMAYKAKVAAGELAPDVFQQAAVKRLDALYQLLTDYQPNTRFDLKKLFSFIGQKQKIPRGLYVFGDVGRGKSMLMQLFYDALKTPHKRRVHFHAFMLEVHDTLHKLRQSKGEKRQDPLKVIARMIAKRTHVLCFDEFHVTNITDAMILKNLFTALFAEGVVMVATSNWRPDDLYKDGLQRDSFLPFIGLLKERVEIFELGSVKDYRLQQQGSEEETYFYPDDENAYTRLQSAFKRVGGTKTTPKAMLALRGRLLEIPKVIGDVAWFTFRGLCDQPLGAGDYLAIIARYKTIFLVGIPQFTDDNQNAAKRFMTLVDVLYDSHIPLYCTAAASPEQLYRMGHLRFEFQRTVSRLVEMRGWGEAED